MLTLASRLRTVIRLVESQQAAVSYCLSRKASEKAEPRNLRGYGKVTPLGVYIKEHFAARNNEKPNEYFAKLTKQWNALTEHEKKKYFEKTATVNEEKRQKLESLSEAEKEELIKKTEDAKQARLRRRLRAARRKRRDEDGNIRPLSGWTLFVKEKASKNVRDSTKDQKEILKDIAAAWRSLSNQEKSNYNERAKAMSNADRSE